MSMNTVAATQKQIEKGYVEEARLTSLILPSGEFVSHEEPDFLLRLDNGTLGIEVTELCREQPRAEAARLAKIRVKAKADYDRMAGSEPIDVSLVFSRRANGLPFKQLTKSLAEFVYANRNSRGITPTRHLPEGYHHIGIHVPSQQTGCWRESSASDTVHAPKQLIESRIAEKNKRLSAYLRSAPEVWLLIVSNQSLGPGGVYVLPHDLAEWKFSFDFEKVLLFARAIRGGGQVFELQRMEELPRTSRPAGSAS